MNYPDCDEILATLEALRPEIVETPVIDGSSLLNGASRIPRMVSVKLELFQKTGSFKIRGALNVMRSLSKAQLTKGVTTFSGGNHAIAVAYAAKALGTSAKVVMPCSANPARISACKDLGAEVFLVETRAEAPKLSQQFEESEGRSLVPPFEHPKTVAGAATVGYEFVLQKSDLDVVLVPIGGGGLAAGVACAIKQLHPKCRIIGVQAKGADAMYRSFQSGAAEFNENVSTVADSLCPPQVGAYTLSVCQEFLDDIWLVEETEIKKAMRLYYEHFKLTVEGSGAVSLAALLSPNGSTFEGLHVGVIVSGSNIDLNTFLVNSGIG